MASYLSSCTRPDVAWAFNQLSQRMASEVIESDFNCLETVFKRLRRAFWASIRKRRWWYSRASRLHRRVNYEKIDVSSHLGYIVVLVDWEKNFSAIVWSSTKYKRVTRSFLAAELYATASTFYTGFAIANTFMSLLGRKVELQVFTDSITLFDVTIWFSEMTENRLLIDIKSLRQVYRDETLAILRWIRLE